MVYRSAEGSEEELVGSSWWAALDADERADANARRAEGRARSRLRRFAASNGCTRLATLTLASQLHRRSEVLPLLNAFQRRLEAAYPGIAWARTLERHKSGAIHAHYLLSMYVPKARLGVLWGHGFVDVRRIRSKRGGREDARQAARYASKYVGKDAAVDAPGDHRYDVRQGFQPIVRRIRARTRVEAADAAIWAMKGEVPAYVWSSDEDETWRGPPVGFFSWR